jgi:hypothetical protein
VRSLAVDVQEGNVTISCLCSELDVQRETSYGHYGLLAFSFCGEGADIEGVIDVTELQERLMGFPAKCHLLILPI